MVEADGVDAVEAGEVVFAGGVVAVPGDDVERGVVEVGGPEIAEELGDDLEGAAVAVFEGGVWGEEVAGVGEAVGSDGAEVGEAEGLAVVLEEVASGLLWLGSFGEEFYTELDASGDEGYFAGDEIDDAEFGVEQEAA